MAVRQTYRIVGRGVQFVRENASHELQSVVHYAVNLRTASQRVRILHAVTESVRFWGQGHRVIQSISFTNH